MPRSRRVDLFYHGYELPALDRPFGRVQSNLHLMARTAYRGLRRRQPYTGFYTAFRNLKRALEQAGLDVHVNDFAHARRNPTQPIGISGHVEVYDQVSLPNPAVFGPGYVPPPEDIDWMAKGNNIRIFTQPWEWPCRILRPKLGDGVQPYFAPIDPVKWPDLSAGPKTHDVIIYDKIRWHRNEMVPRLLNRLQRHLEARNLNHVVLRYGDHPLAQFRAALKGGRTLAFLCEHETQGLAYQEAMASGLPVFAWDEGRLVDPHEIKNAPPDFDVSSVPYFDARCGMTFTEADLEDRFDRFWEARDSYAPRAFVAETLSPQRAARIYLDLLDRAAAA